MNCRSTLLGVFFATLLLSGFGFAGAGDDYLDVQLPEYIAPETTLFVYGTVYQDGSASANNTVYAYLYNTSYSTSNSSTSNENGTFNITLPIPAYEGEYTFMVNSSNFTFSKSVATHLDYFTSASFSFVGAQPPFGPHDNVTLKITAYNSTGSGLGSHNISFNMYASNGPAMDWFVPMTALTDENGSATFSYQVNASATSGMAVAEMGSVAVLTIIKKMVLAATSIDPTTLESREYIPTSYPILLQAKLTDSSGNAIANTSVDYVNATITKPDGTSTTVAMTYNKTGVYRYPFTDTSSTGTYAVGIAASADSSAESTSTVFKVKHGSVRIERRAGFFAEWGNKQVISPGSSVSLLVLGTNLATGDLLTANGLVNGTNCSSIVITSFKNPVSGADLTTSVSATTGIGMYMMVPACSITFTAPSSTGIYSMGLNITMNVSGNMVTEGAATAVPVQRYVLKANPISLISDMDNKMPFSLLTPGETAYFSIKARNISGSNDVTDISNLTVLGIMPMGEFSSGAASYIPFYTTNYSFNSTSGIMTAEIPTTVVGPATIDVQAAVAGETVRGDGFFMSKHVMGFVSPPFGGKQQGGGGDMGGPGGPGGGEPSSGGPGMGEGDTASCVAGVNMTLMGHVFDIKSFQPKQSVIVTLDSIREESTGKDVTSCFSTAGGTTSDSGTVNISMSLSSSCTYAGRYFALFDTQFQGKSDKIPGAFNCKNLNFWPSLAAFDVGLSDELNITVNNIFYTQNTSKQLTNGTVSIRQVMNFDPSSGPMPYTLSGTITGNVSSGQGRLAISPSSVGRSRWRSGFTDMIVRVCDRENTCDEGFIGFKTSAFRAYWSDMTSAFGTTAMPGQTISYGAMVFDTLNESATRDGTGAVKLMNFMSPEPTVITNFTFYNVSGSQTETYRINVTLPEDIKRGQYGLMIELYNMNMSKGSLESFMDIFSFTVYGMESQRRGGPRESWYCCGEDEPVLDENSTEDQQKWNMTLMNHTLGGMINSSSEQSIEDFGEGGNRLYIMSVYNDSAGAYTCAFVRPEGGSPNPAGPYYLYQNFTPTAYIIEFDSSDGAVWWIDTNNKRKEWPWAGRHKVNSSFVVPLYVARRADAYNESAGYQPQENVTISIPRVAKMYDTGMGVETMLTLGADSDGYATSSATTGANGLAFPTLRVTNASYAKVFWKAVRGNTNEYASFDDAPFTQIIAFQVDGRLLAQKYVIPLTFYENLTVANFSIAPDKSPAGKDKTLGNFQDTLGCPSNTSGIYYGNYSEDVYGADAFIADKTSGDWNAQPITTTFHFVLVNCSGTYNLTFIDDDLNMNATDASGQEQGERDGPSVAGQYTEKYFYLSNPTADDPWLDWRDVRFYTPGGSTTNVTLLKESMDREFTRVSSATTPVYGRVSANEFNQSKVVGANVTVKYQEFQPMAPPTQITLNTTSMTTSLAMPTTDTLGVAYFEIRPHTTWSACGSGDSELMTRITTANSRVEETWLGKVCYQS